MNGFQGTLRALALIPALTLALPGVAWAQATRAGVVTTLEGTATIVRTSAPEPAPLKFKDDVFVHDRIATGSKSVARILLGGKAIVTVREQSTLTITEVPGVSTVNVGHGRIAVAVVKERMQQGEVVEIRTPNAVAGIRGTIVVAEVSRDRSVITVLRGLIDVTRIDEAGRTTGSPVLVGALQQINVPGSTPQPLTPPQPITRETAQSLAAEFKNAPPKNAPPASMAPLNQAEVERAAATLAALLPSAPAPGKTARGKTDTTDKIDKADNGRVDADRNDDTDDKADPGDKGGRGDRVTVGDTKANGGTSTTGSASSTASGSASGATASTTGGASIGGATGSSGLGSATGAASSGAPTLGGGSALGSGTASSGGMTSGSSPGSGAALGGGSVGGNASVSVGGGLAKPSSGGLGSVLGNNGGLGNILKANDSWKGLKDSDHRKGGRRDRD